MDFWKKTCKKISEKIKEIPLWTLGLSLGIVFLLLGYFGEQFTDIYKKAVMICLECIGIG